MTLLSQYQMLLFMYIYICKCKYGYFRFIDLSPVVVYSVWWKTSVTPTSDHWLRNLSYLYWLVFHVCLPLLIRLVCGYLWWSMSYPIVLRPLIFVLLVIFGHSTYQHKGRLYFLSQSEHRSGTRHLSYSKKRPFRVLRFVSNGVWL